MPDTFYTDLGHAADCPWPAMERFDCHPAHQFPDPKSDAFHSATQAVSLKQLRVALHRDFRTPRPSPAVPAGNFPNEPNINVFSREFACLPAQLFDVIRCARLRSGCRLGLHVDLP
jgi:hypothetical protein